MRRKQIHKQTAVEHMRVSVQSLATEASRLPPLRVNTMTQEHVLQLAIQYPRLLCGWRL